ncbi:MAG: sulfite exporter TauE/SafE family protein [Paracoccaceae bacterium]|nr:sulfite exporter TauE/SafE family protein [Paracoccaceae bacterium]
MPTLEPTIWAAVVAIALFAGLVKGAVGFAMPMILISGLGTFLAPELALAALILPTVASNLLQAARGGLRNAIAATRTHRIYLAIVLVMIVLSAQIVLLLPDGVMFLLIGVPITLFAALQLVGWRPRVAAHLRRATEVTIALFAGFIGGIAGVWGPPTVLYLTALETPKREAVQIQGVVYGLGAVTLLAAHLNSGVFTGERAAFSALLCIPAGLGMLAGFWLQDRMDQERFRSITLAVLVVAGLNLIRRGLVG